MSNLLVNKFPLIAKEFDYDKNVNMDVNKITYGSNKKIWWKCQKGHSYSSVVKDRSGGHGCSVCSGRIPSIKKLAIIVMPNIMNEYNIERNSVNLSYISYGSGKMVWWKCKCGYEYEMRVCDRHRGRGCSICSGNIVSDKNRLSVLYPDIFLELDLEKNINVENVSFSSNKKLWWKCPIGHSYNSSPNSRTNGGHGCSYCSGQKVCEDNCLATKNPLLIKEWHNKNILTPFEVVPFSMKKVWWVCKNGHEWEATIADRSSGRGCPKCSKRVSKPSQKWLSYIGVPEENREKSININGSYFLVDGINYDRNIIYEFYGDYWHGNPKIYDKNKYNSHNKKLFGQLYEDTIERRIKLEAGGFKVIFIWESEWKKILKK